MKKTFIIFLNIIFSLLIMGSENSHEDRIFDFFIKSNYLSRTIGLYQKSPISLTRMEKAELLTEGIRVLTHEKTGFKADMDFLKALKTAVSEYKNELELIGHVRPDTVLRQIRSMMLNRRDMEFGYSPSAVVGIKANEILDRAKVTEPTDESAKSLNQPDYISPKYEITVDRIIGYSISGKSYFGLTGAFFDPDFGFTGSDFTSGIDLGFNKSGRVSYDIRMRYFTDKASGGFFGGVNDNYDFSFYPVSFSIKRYLFHMKRLVPYVGYGITFARADVTLNSTGFSDSYYFPHVYYGVEFFEKKGFSYYGDMNYYLTDDLDISINNRRYRFSPSKLFLSFGIKFYFRG